MNAIEEMRSMLPGLPERDEAAALEGFRAIVGAERAVLRAAASPETREFLEAMDRFRAGGGEADALDAFKTYLRSTLPAPVVKLCVTGFVTDTAGRLLLVHHRERGWELPGGKVEPGEPWQSALVREVREETGLDVALVVEHPRLLVGGPAPSAPFVSWIALARGIAEGDPRPGAPDGSIDEARWFARDEVPLDGLSQLAIADVVRAWTNDDDPFDVAARNAELSTWSAAIRIASEIPCPPPESDTASAGAERMRKAICDALPAAAGGLPERADETGEDPPVRCGTFHAADPGATCGPCSEVLGSPSVCALSHDFTPVAYATTAFERLAAMIPAAGPLRDAWQAFVTAREAEPLPETSPRHDRERLGRIVREVWIEWAREQPNPKASWLVPWEGMSEPDCEVDRRIGERLFAEGRSGGDPLPNPLLVPLTRYADALDEVARQEGCGKNTRERLHAAARLVRGAAGEAPTSHRWTPPKLFQGVISDDVVPGGAWEIPGNHPSRIVALRSQVDELRQRFDSYAGGDRPMSPPADLMRELQEAERRLADAERNPAP